MKLSDQQINHPILTDDNELTRAVIEHLLENAPDVVKAYPPGYFIMLVRHSACLARDEFGLDDVQAICLFVSLRWEIAPGYYQHPPIEAALKDRSIPAMERFERLLLPENEHVWLDAAAYDGPEYWRGSKASGFMTDWVND